MQEYIGSFFRAAFIIRLFLKVLFLQEETIKRNFEFHSRRENRGISCESIFHTKQKGKGSADKERLGGLEDTVTPWRVV